MSKPKDFYLDYYETVDPKEEPDALRVIEYSAYEAVVDQRDKITNEYMDACESLKAERQRNEKLEARVKVLKHALDFYAKEDTHTFKQAYMQGIPCDGTPIRKDEGTIARIALKHDDEMGAE